jgi:hypothetical protein
MSLTRLDNLYSSKTGKYLYVSPDDFNATDTLDNRGNSPLRPFKTIQRAFLEVSRFSYQPGANNDRFDQFSIMLMPGDHYIDNRPGLVNYSIGGNNQDRNRYYDAGLLIESNKQFIVYEAYARMLDNNVGFTLPLVTINSILDDVSEILDNIIYNIKFGGNDRTFDSGLLYQNNQQFQTSSYQSEVQEVYANANDLAISVIKQEIIGNIFQTAYLTELNLQSAFDQVFDPLILTGPAIQGGQIEVSYGQIDTCADVQSNLNTLFTIISQGISGALELDDRTNPETLAELPVFNFDQSLGQWQDSSVIDLRNPDNIFWKFNASTGGTIVPRGCSLVGYDLRRTVVRPLYVPDPADSDQERTSIFNLTGGCYLWQFTIKDGDLSENSPLFNTADNVGKVYYQKGNITDLAVPEYSHHKITIMEYADNFELVEYYKKIGIAFSKYQPSIDDPGEFEALAQENRIVGPLSDTRFIDNIKPVNTNTGQPNQKLVINVTTKIDHGYFKDQYVAILNLGLDEELNGTFKVASIDQNNPKVFTYEIPNKVAAGLGLTNNQTYTAGSGISSNAVAQAEIDSVESASPYVFNCSIRSIWGICGMWANGSKATGFRSMVVAQYTGVSLQKDDRAFIRYDEFTNTWNQASLTSAFASVPYHAKGDSYWKDEWRNFHIRASEDSFIQCVSVFAVGFFDHFLMESGGDMSITNSNSNFGNTSLHSIGHKGYSFNQDKGGYITHIIPPKALSGGYRATPLGKSVNSTEIAYYPIDVPTSNDPSNFTRLYLGTDTAFDPDNRPAATLSGYRIGGRPDEKIYVELEPISPGGNTIFEATLSPTGIDTYNVSVDFLNPTSVSIDTRSQDASNSIASNKTFIQDEVYGYLTKKYPNLLTNPDRDILTCRRDIGYYIDAVVQDLKLGGNVNSVQAAEAYFSANQLIYITNQLNEAIDVLGVTKDFTIAAMRNWNYLLTGCSTTNGSATISVPSTSGLVVGMKIQSYASFNPLTQTEPAGAPTINIPAGSYVKRIIDETTIEIGIKGSYNFGSEPGASYSPSLATRVASQTITASGPGTGAILYFTLRDETQTTSYPGGPAAVRDGIFSTIRSYYDDSIGEDSADVSTGGTERDDIALVIEGYFTDIAQILSSDPDNSGVEKIEPDTDFSVLSRRATIFTILGASDAHKMETGTPVRLVPKPLPGTNPDPRVIRLPKGFDTNVVYYVIAPGRQTAPEDFSSTTIFDGSNQSVFLLATTLENAKAGNYIYSPETDSLNPDLVIEVNKYIVDTNYSLQKYESTISVGSGTGVIKTSVSHAFDIPSDSIDAIDHQKVFFRSLNGANLPTRTISVGGVVSQVALNPQDEFWVRYFSPNEFKIYTSFEDSKNNVNEVVLNGNTTFLTYSNKRFSPLRFEPKPTSNNNVANSTGQWYLRCVDEVSNVSNQNQNHILYRFNANTTYSGSSPGELRTSDTFFERVNDGRIKEDRTYKLRYVIPRYLGTVRDPLNGFVLKVRTDTKRRLRPQKIVLKPIVSTNHGQSDSYTSSSIARFLNNANIVDTANNPQEQIGWSRQIYKTRNIDVKYDPYLNPKNVETLNGKIQFTIESAKIISQDNGDGTQYKYLEAIAFDHTIVNQAIKNEKFTIVKIKAPQGPVGVFASNTTANNQSNLIQWSGHSSGTGYLHGYFTTEDKPFNSSAGGSQEYYLIIKNITNGEINFNSIVATTFFQGGSTPQGSVVFAQLAAKPDSVGDSTGKSKSSKEDYLYSFKGTNVYTLVPGDVVRDDFGGEFYIDTIEDVGEIEDTFYIFSIEEVKQRIPGQQDGIYYLTCLKGNVSPFPTGAGVGNNFKNFKFSQPVAYIYPQDYKNDPLWYEKLDPAYYGSQINDPPATYSAADNYVHGLVTVNDSKFSETKEAINTLIENPVLTEYSFDEYLDVDSEFSVDARIRAQFGNAESGSEDRLIPIKGISQFPSEERLYVELRRPSIARSGNHTFEYLGFGPGNYSTGFPLRQEVILTDTQDFYAQAKREDGGIVFYTGLNSNGDLYIGNKKINAITGEETFLESAELIGFGEEDDDLGGALVTTFTVPVTFREKITVKGPADFSAPVTIRVQPGDAQDPTAALRILSLVDPALLGEDPTLDRTSFQEDSDGDIRLSKNRINSAIFALNPRGNGASGIPGQDYSIRTHYNFQQDGGSPSNVTPDQSPENYSLSNINSNKLFANQSVYYGNTDNQPIPGDILLKGKEVGKSGSLGWIYANTFEIIPNNLIQTVSTPKINDITEQLQVGTGGGEGYTATNLIRLSWAIAGGAGGAPITNRELNEIYGLSLDSIIRTIGVEGQQLSQRFNGRFTIYPETWDIDGQFIDIQVNGLVTFDLVETWNTPSVGGSSQVSVTNSDWKEFGIIGSESIRTLTSTLGDFRVGINTVARSPHSSYENSYVDSLTTDPRANLDIVGNLFVSGTGTPDYRSQSNPSNRVAEKLPHAFVLGGNSLNPGGVAATFRVATTDDSTPDGVGYQIGGRIGINTILTDLDRNFVVKGNARITGDFKFENDIDINGGGGANTADVRTSITSGTFNFITNSTFVGTANLANWATTLNAGARATTISIGSTTTSSQTINLGTAALSQTLNLGTAATTQDVNIGVVATTFDFDLGSPLPTASRSRVTLGGAYNQNQSLSFTTIKTKQTNIWGDLSIGLNKSFGDTLDVTGTAGTVNFFSNSGATSTLNFATNAAVIAIGAQGGITTVRNSLAVDATLSVKGNSIVVGGTAAFSFNGTRSRLGSAQTSHTGTPTGIPTDKNVDFITITTTTNVLDTAGTSTWGGTFFQQAIPTFTGDDTTALIALTGKQYYLPIVNPPTDISEGDDLLIDTAISGSRHPEIVRVAVGGLRRVNSTPYYLIVERQPYGTFLPTRTDHPDTTTIRKVNASFDSTWLTANIDGTGTSDIVSLSEFGGQLPQGSYLFLSRNSAGTSGEAVLVGTSTSVSNKKFQIFNGANVLKFEVDTISGATLISDSTSNGGLTVFGPTNLTGISSTLTVDGSVTLNSTTRFNGNALFPDNVKLIFGSSSDPNSVNNDLEIYHNGNNSVINNVGAGNLYIDAVNDVIISSNSILERRARFVAGGAVELYYDNSLKLNTATYGVNITERLNVQGITTLTGDLTVSSDLIVNGGDFTVNSGATERFAVNANGSIDFGGITNYFTPTGGRKWIFVPVNSNTQNSITDDERLVSNTNYFVVPTGNNSVLILLLPTSPQTGDMIRLVDVAGQLKYNTQLVIRAATGVRIQGDATGSGLGLTSGTYGGGELIINTPNAAFGLIYLGATDGNGTSVPSANRGWWLTEI